MPDAPAAAAQISAIIAIFFLFCFLRFSLRLFSISDSCFFLSSIIFSICSRRFFSLSSKISPPFSPTVSAPAETAAAAASSSVFNTFVSPLSTEASTFAPQNSHSLASSGICEPHLLHNIYPTSVSSYTRFNYIGLSVSNQYQRLYMCVTIKRQNMTCHIIFPNILKYKQNKDRNGVKTEFVQRILCF